MTREKALDALRRAGRTFVQAAGAYLILNPTHVDAGKALVVGAAAAGLSAVWRLFLDPAEPPTLLPLAVGSVVEPQPPVIQVHVAGTDPAKVADEVGRQLKRHVTTAPAAGGVVSGGHPDPLSKRPVPPPPDPGKRSS